MNEHVRLLVLSDVNAERYRQDAIHPEKMNRDKRFQTVMEEVGEVATALLNEDDENLYEEVIQAAATLVRFAEQLVREKEGD